MKAVHIGDLMMSMFVLRFAARNATYHKRVHRLLGGNANASSRPRARSTRLTRKDKSPRIERNAVRLEMDIAEYGLSLCSRSPTLFHRDY